jgi:transcriptional regulator GlxA family with amidase domain
MREMLERRGPAKKEGRILLIPAGSGPELPKADDPAIIRRIQKAHREGAVVASVCAGAAWIAAAGIDGGRPITTHWGLAADLAARRADLRVVAAELIFDHGDLITAGGLLAWVDLGLHLAERFWSSEDADAIARLLVWDRNRRSQVPYTPTGKAWIPLRPDPLLDKALVWARLHFCDPISMVEWAGAAALGQRTMERRWAVAFGETPLRWLQTVRVEEARRLLEEGTSSWEAITSNCGYSDPASFRELFERRVGRKPGEYRGRGDRART